MAVVAATQSAAIQSAAAQSAATQNAVTQHAAAQSGASLLQDAAGHVALHEHAKQTSHGLSML